MRFKTSRHALVIGALTVALGIVTPTVAFGAEGVPDALDDNQMMAPETPVREESTPTGATQGLNGVEASSVTDDNGTDLEAEDSENSTDTATDSSEGNGDTTEDNSEDTMDTAADTTDVVTPTKGNTEESETAEEMQATSDADETDGDAGEQVAPTVSNQSKDTETTAMLKLAAVPDSDSDLKTSSSTDVESDERPIPNGTYVLSSKKKATAVVEVAGGQSKSGTNVQINTSNGSSAQKWDLRYVSGGFYNIFKHGTNLALDVLGGKTANGTNVRLYTKNGSKAQLWKFVSTGKGYYKIVSALRSNVVLDIAGANTKNGTNVQVYKSNDTDAQRFKLYEVKKAPRSNVTLADGTYSIRTAPKTSFSLDVAGASKANDTNVQLYSSNKTQAQKFYFESDGKGYYIITVIGSGKVLSTENASVIPACNVKQKTYNGADYQKWSIQKKGGSYTIVNKATRLVLDVSGAKFSNGANVQTYRSNGTDAQKFKIWKTNTINDGIYTISSFKATSKVLETEGASTASKAAIRLNGANGGIAQRFEVKLISSNGQEIYRIRTGASGGLFTWLIDGTKSVVQMGSSKSAMSSKNKWAIVWNGRYFSLKNTGTGKVLDLVGGSTSNGTVLQVYKANGTDAQHFFYNPTNLLPNGVYLVNSAVPNQRLALDVKNTSTGNGANLQVYTKSGTDGQQFNITATGSTTDKYVIRNVNSGKVVSVSGSSKQSGANVIQNTYTGAASQKWKAEIGDGGYVMFINVNSGLALDVNGGDNARANSNVQQYKVVGNSAQKWRMTRIGWQVSGTTYNYYDVNGNKSTFNESSYKTWKRIKNKTSNTDYLMGIDRDRCYANIYTNAGGVWQPLYSWRCAVGNPASPTPVGEWLTTGRRGTVHVDVEYTAKWVIEVKSPWAFNIHSTPFKPDGRVLTARLGAWITGGCCRLSVDNAHWVYSNIKGGTRVFSY